MAGKRLQELRSLEYHRAVADLLRERPDLLDVARERVQRWRWKDRLVPIQNENTLGKIGWCLEVHDLAAHRERNFRRLRPLTSTWATARVKNCTIELSTRTVRIRTTYSSTQTPMLSMSRAAIGHGRVTVTSRRGRSSAVAWLRE